jgi:predicted nucleic acid-binding protein
MIAVPDTSPICYLVWIGEIELLPRLFTHVWLPQAVVDELLHPDAPKSVREWAADLPSWASPPKVDVRTSAGLEKLQAGEKAAILLAESLDDGIVILDEKAARSIAAGRGLRVTGTLGVLCEASTRDLVDLAAAIDRLRKTNFRCSPALLKAALDRFHT